MTIIPTFGTELCQQHRDAPAYNLVPLHHGGKRLSELSGLDDSALHYGKKLSPIFEYCDVRRYVALDEKDVGEFPRLQRAELVATAHYFRSGLRGAGDDFERREAHVLYKERQLARIVSVRVPAETIVAAHAESSACPQYSQRAR